jgi:predicted negative regulator of RcsB-dependent stress response
MNETQIRERLHRAVGEARYPAYLPARVAGRLKNPAREPSPQTFRRRSDSPRLAGLGRTGSLIGVLLVVLLIVALAVGVNAWRAGNLVNIRPAPAGLDPAVKKYQAMVSADDQRVKATASGYFCTTYAEVGCLPAMAVQTAALQALQTAALQQFLDDLSRSQPPARFAALDALLRRHLVLAISASNAFVTAYKVKDDKGTTEANDAFSTELNAIINQDEDISVSSQGTVAAYSTDVRLDKELLLACVLCQQFVGQDQVSCRAGQTPSCIDEIAAIRLQVETFQEDVARTFAPDSLAAKDGRMQADLLAADRSLDAMASALSAGDQVALQAGHDALRQALSRVESDAADIASSH